MLKGEEFLSLGWHRLLFALLQFLTNPDFDQGWTDAIGGGCQSNQHLKGDIDELRIYDRALTESEVQDLYNLGQ